MPVSSNENRLAVNGEACAAAEAEFKRKHGKVPKGFTVKQMLLPGATRGGGAQSQMPVSARDGLDIVVLKIKDGPELILSPENAQKLLSANGGSLRDADGSAAHDLGESIGWQQACDPGTSRGKVREWLCRTDWMAVLESPVQVLGQHAALGLAQNIDAKIREGVFQLSRQGPGTAAVAEFRIPPRDDAKPILVLIHGTFVDTAATFGGLWDKHPEVVDELFTHYGDAVYGLDHATLGVSPIHNALTLAQALPIHARVHLLTHSRGGLVGEILAKVSDPGYVPGNDEFACLTRQVSGGDYSTHIQELKQLERCVAERKFRVERMVRVACPARGTLLASRRLDAYLSVLRWLLSQAQLGPIADSLMEFLCAVARERTNPAELPGLEAMMPESPLITWLNAPASGVNSQLVVVAGDSEGGEMSSWGGLTAWLKTLVADAFFWTDNDLVVQTRSMYGGVLRRMGDGSGALYHLAKDRAISHFRYFLEATTVQRILDGLTRDARSTMQGQWTPIGTLSWSGESASGLRGASASSAATDSMRDKPENRPAVIVIPDFMGSRLVDQNEQEVWPTATAFAALEALDMRAGRQRRELRACGLLSTYYGDLTAYLRESHEVIEFAYDWRQPLESHCERLAKLIRSELHLRNQTMRPVRVLVHGMGGLLMRAMQLDHTETWTEMMARDGVRLLMLGVPHGGSWVPMQVLTGDNSLGDTISAAGPLFHEQKVREVLAAMPGFLQLQAGMTDAVLLLNEVKTWKRLAKDDAEANKAFSSWHETAQWGLPNGEVLDKASGLRRRLEAQLPSFCADAGKMVAVIGRGAPHTPDGLVVSKEGLQYRCVVEDGDGVVTLASARLRGVHDWQLKAGHGDLTRSADAFKAYVELLCNGECVDLTPVGPDAQPRQQRGTDGRRVYQYETCRPSKVRGGIELPHPSDIFRVIIRQGMPNWRNANVLHVAVQHGNLKFVKQPLLIGHYRSMRLSGAEAVVDPLLNGRMREALRAGLYPEAIGFSHVFENKQARTAGRHKQVIPRPEAVIVVGLGEEGALKGGELAYSVRQGVLSYSQRLAEASQQPLPDIELAATLLGSGGTGISLSSAALSIVQGVIDANTKLRETDGCRGASQWPAVGKLTLVEVYLDRATDAWRVLKMQSEATPSRLQVEGDLVLGEGRLRRPLDSSYRGATYDFIRVMRMPGKDASHPLIAYQLDSKRARTEVRAQRQQASLVAELVANASASTQIDPQMGRTLFQLLVPLELEPYLAGSVDMVMELDPSTAALPWEMLDTDCVNKRWGMQEAEPWALRSKLIRKLRLEDFRPDPLDATQDDNVIVIGEPRCDPAQYRPLPGAKREALAVSKAAQSASGGMAGERVVTLANNDDMQTILNALCARDYRIIHIAGHGRPGIGGGVVLSGENIVLGASEISTLRAVPELVFLNCCHLAHDDIRPLADFSRTAFAATIAEELIRIGVRCVIAAGWAVEDLAAEKFAVTFYSNLFRGDRFIDAVGKARRAAWESNPKGNTWAAYQCYGDPEWSWRRSTEAPQVPPSEEYGGISSPVNLTVVLESLATEADQAQPSEAQRFSARIEYLAGQFGEKWRGEGQVAEAFALAYSSVQNREKALLWFERARAAGNGGVTLMGLQRYAAQLCLPGSPRKDVEQAVSNLNRLLQVGETLARHTILALALRRLHVDDYADEDRYVEAMENLEQAQVHFDKASKSNVIGDAKYQFYPARAALGCLIRKELIRAIRGEARNVEERELNRRFAEAEEAVAKGLEQDTNFWSVMAQSELDVLRAVCSRTVATVLDDVLHSIADLQRRIAAARIWGYVHDEAKLILEPYEKILQHQPLSDERQQRQELAAVAKLLERLQSNANLGSY